MVRQLLWAACLLTVSGLGGGGGVMAAAEERPSVVDLSVTTDYHSVDISWRHGGSTRAFGFSVGYCELQAWGANRCKSKVGQPETSILVVQIRCLYKMLVLFIKPLQIYLCTSILNLLPLHMPRDTIPYLD